MRRPARTSARSRAGGHSKPLRGRPRDEAGPRPGYVNLPTGTAASFDCLPQPPPWIARIRTPKAWLTRSAISGRVSGSSNAPSAASMAASTTRSGTPFPSAQRISFSARRAEPRTKIARCSEGTRNSVRRMHEALTRVRSLRASSTCAIWRSRTLDQSEICAAESSCA